MRRLTHPEVTVPKFWPHSARNVAPGLAWVVTIALIALGAWLELGEVRSAIRFVESYRSAAPPTSPR